jgi:uroporphyrinogen decarboxylase
MQDSLLIRALNQKAVERTPVWLMRQAGRYLPEYREVRRQVRDFWELCQTPELACEVTLQPLRRYDLDAAIVFSDILTIPDALGAKCHFLEKQGPVFDKVFSNADDLKALEREGLHLKLDYVYDTIRLVRAKMPKHLPLIGFSGSPWTLACYMIEGRSSREFDKVFQLMYLTPKLLQDLLELLADVVADYLIEQARAGIQALMIFDTWGGILPALQYQKYNLASFQNIISKVKKVYPHIPIVIFGKNTGFWLDSLAKTGCDGLSLDWTVDIGLARKKLLGAVSLQGNLHPNVLLQTDACIQQEATNILHAFGPHPGHVFNLGHGITPLVRPEAVEVLIDCVKNVSGQLHAK